MYYFCHFKADILMSACCLEAVSFAAIVEILEKGAENIFWYQCRNLGTKFQWYSIVQERGATVWSVAMWNKENLTQRGVGIMLDRWILIFRWTVPSMWWYFFCFLANILFKNTFHEVCELLNSRVWEQIEATSSAVTHWWAPPRTTGGLPVWPLAGKHD